MKEFCRCCMKDFQNNTKEGEGIVEMITKNI